MYLCWGISSSKTWFLDICEYVVGADWAASHVFLLLQRWYWLSLTLVTLHWPASCRFNSTVRMRSWMTRPDLSSRLVAMITSLRCSAACTGFGRHSGYLTSWPARSTSVSVDLDRPTSLMLFSQLPWFQVDNACGHRPPRHWTFRQHDCLLSATERSPSLRHKHGTVCQLKWHHQFPANFQN